MSNSYLCFKIFENHSSDTLQMSLFAVCKDEEEVMHLSPWESLPRRFAVIKAESGQVFDMTQLENKWIKDVKHEGKQIIFFDLNKSGKK